MNKLFRHLCMDVMAVVSHVGQGIPLYVYQGHLLQL